MRRRSELLSEGLLSEQSEHSRPAFSHMPLPAGHAAGNGVGIGGSSDDLQCLAQNTPPSPRTFKTRAVYYLSKREHSRAELAKKLSQPTYKARQSAFVHKTELPAAPSAELIESVLDDLQRQGFLNDDRFAQGLARKNASKYGAARVMASLGQHKLDANTTLQLATQLKYSELPRCYEVWSKRFSHIDRSSMDYTESQAALGKQGRFLMQRGFSGDAVKKVLNGWLPESQ
jgi:regulatory protein